MGPDPAGEGPDEALHRIGVFGGTFDPPHVGHLIVAGDVAEALNLERMIWIPAGRPPHKDAGGVTDGAVRLDMTRAAVGDDPRFEVSGMEVGRPGPSFTVDTLRALRDQHPGSRLYLVLGADQFRALDEWREPEEIGRLATIAVMDRDGTMSEKTEPAVPVQWERVPVTRIDISSTDVRRRVADGASVRNLVTEGVRRIIEDRRLYSRGS
jgi:nicotinate-nucleotide adenylyltransferase